MNNHSGLPLSLFTELMTYITATQFNNLFHHTSEVQKYWLAYVSPPSLPHLNSVMMNVVTALLQQSWAFHSPSTTGNGVLNTRFLLINSYPKFHFRICFLARNTAVSQLAAEIWSSLRWVHWLQKRKQVDYHSINIFLFLTYLYIFNCQLNMFIGGK